jgi:hypothetical protein
MLLFALVTIVSHIATRTSLAAPIIYVFSKASTVLNGFTEQISGTFVFSDPLTQEAADITLSGPTPFAGAYTFGMLSHTASVVGFRPPGLAEIRVGFAHPLTLSVDPDPLSMAVWSFDVVPAFVDFAPVGFAVPVATPEPTSAALLGAALGLLLLRPRTKQARPLRTFRKRSLTSSPHDRQIVLPWLAPTHCPSPSAPSD